MKLTINELAPYLPYGLKFKGDAGITTLSAISTQRGLQVKCIDTIGNAEHISLNRNRPILRPLSDLNDGEVNTPEEIQKCCWSYTQYLISNNYDIFGLIAKGLAINMNEI